MDQLPDTAVPACVAAAAVAVCLAVAACVAVAAPCGRGLRLEEEGRRQPGGAARALLAAS